MKTMKLSLLACIALVMGVVSCKKDDVKEPKETIIVKTDSIRVTTDTRTGHYSFFSLKDDKVVPVTDSASANWDFGIRFFTIIVNSHASGPGNTGVITQFGNYNTYNQAPTSGYAYDTTTNKLAINSSVQNGWFDYNSSTHAFSPKAGLFFVFKTTDNKYAKLELLSASYEAFTGPMPLWVNYKFQYTYQSDGTPNF